MDFLIYISDYIMPFLIFYIVGFGILMKVDVYDVFVDGARKGFKTVVEIMPTLVGLMVGVGALRNSGFLEFVGKMLGNVAEGVNFPGELIPLVIVRLFSSSAAIGLILDIFKTHGTDSFIGFTASLIASCTETVFYTMSVYFLAAKVTKTRWTLPGALIATFAGIVASVVLAGLL